MGEIVDANILNLYFKKVSELLNGVEINSVGKLVQDLRNLRKSGDKVLIAGNGGSAALSSHFATDIGPGSLNSGTAVKCLSLVDNSPILTAASNDFGYQFSLSRQVDHLGEHGDLLFVISSSGNSQNLVEAIKIAKNKRIKTFALLGFDGGIIKNSVDDYILIKSNAGEYGAIEDIHSIILHSVTQALREGNHE